MKQAIYIIGIVLVVALAWKLCGPRAAAPTAAPTLSAQWNQQVYSLDEDEAERFVPPPFSPQRMSFSPYPLSGMPRQVAYQMPGRMSQPIAIVQPGTLTSALTVCAGNKWLELDLPEKLRLVPVDGDWVVNMALPAERRNKAMESIVRSVTGRDLIIEKRMLQRDVIVARGTWAFVPLANQPSGNTRWLQFYTDQLDPPRGTFAIARDLTEILARLEGCANRRVIDEVTGRSVINVPYVVHASSYRAGQNEEALAQLLDNLTRQTSLEFVRTRREMPIWFVRDRPATTQPVNQK